jgi:hypothetical protein
MELLRYTNFWVWYSVFVFLITKDSLLYIPAGSPDFPLSVVGDVTTDPTHEDEKKCHIFLITWPRAQNLQSKFFFCNVFCKILFCRHYFSPLNTFVRKEKDPDPYIWLMDPDPGGPKTCGSPGSGSPTQPRRLYSRYVVRSCSSQLAGRCNPPSTTDYRTARSPWLSYHSNSGVSVLTRWKILLKRGKNLLIQAYY